MDTKTSIVWNFLEVKYIYIYIYLEDNSAVCELYNNNTDINLVKLYIIDSYIFVPTPQSLWHIHTHMHLIHEICIPKKHIFFCLRHIAVYFTAICCIIAYMLLRHIYQY